MPRLSNHAARIRQTADAQDGLITAAQLAEIGVSPGTIAHRLRPGGMWSRVLPGVHLVTGGAPDRRQRERASLLYAGDSAVLTGVTALRNHGFRALQLQESDDTRTSPAAVFVLIPHSRRRVATSYVRIERTARLPAGDDVVHRQGLGLAAPPRAIADAARRLRDPDDVTALAIEGVRRALTTIDALEAELRDGSRRGSAHLRIALDVIRGGAWSAPEGHLRQACRQAGLPEPVLNGVLLTSSGRYVARPDAWIDEVALAVEVDSQEHHADGRDWERTLARQARYARAGVSVLPITPRQLRDERDGVVRALRDAYDAAAARPRPAMRIVLQAVVLNGGTDPRRWAG